MGMVAFVIGAVPILRFLWFYVTGEGDGHIQSLVLGGAMIILSGLCILVGLLADLINYNRQLVEMTLERVRRMELNDLAERERRDPPK